MPQTTSDPNRQIAEQYLKPQQPTYTTTEGEPVKFLEWNPTTASLTIEDPETYMPLFSVEKRKKSAIMLGPAISRWGQLKQLTRQLEGGPYSMDGRDGVLKIHNSKANRPVSHKYTYAGGSGELLEVTIDTKFVATSVEAGKSTEVDPDDLTVTQHIVQGIPNTDAMPQAGTMRWWPAEKQPKIKPDATRYENPSALLYSGHYVDATKVVQRYMDQPSQGTEYFEGREYPKSYANQSKAAQKEADKYQITQSDVDAYIQQLQKNFDFIKNKEYHSIDDLKQVLKTINRLDDYVIKKKVWVRRWVQPENYGKTETRSDRNVYGINNRPTGWEATAAVEKRWREGFNYLKKQADIRIVNKPGSTYEGSYKGYGVRDSIQIMTYQEIEVPINGARLLASPYLTDIATAMGNDITQTLQNQIKMNATIVGNPSMESSMNVEIQNISTRYSGVYYSKKVSHKINQSGYFCDIDFVQKTVPVSTNTIRASVNTQRMYANLNSVAKKSLITESYKKPDLYFQQFKEWRKDLQSIGASGIMRQDPTNPDNFKVQVAKQDFSATYANSSVAAAMKTGGNNYTLPQNVTVVEE